MNTKIAHNIPSEPSRPLAAALAGFLTMIATPAIAAEHTIEQTHNQTTALTSEQADAEPITEAAITAAIEEYVRAKYTGDNETVRSRTHSVLARRAVSSHYWGEPTKDWVRPYTQDHLKFYGTSLNQTRTDTPEDGRCEIEIFDIAQRTASARVIMEDVVDYLHMIHFEGRWLIADSGVIILDPVGDKPPAKSSPEIAGKPTDNYAQIEQIVRDYCVGFYELDGQKVQSTCHTLLSKRVVEQAEPVDIEYLREITYEEIEILGNTFNKEFNFDPETARCEIEIYEVRKNVAAVKMTGTIWFDYIHLLKVNGQWQIVNIMFEGLPRDEWVDIKQ
tara:strand:- start:75354 stop:76352 length:999 start_codon:yes stop_codon:yes gene_type:complete